MMVLPLCRAAVHISSPVIAEGYSVAPLNLLFGKDRVDCP